MINIWLDSLASDHLDATQTKLIFSTLAQLAEQNTTTGQLQVQLHNSHAEPAVAQLKQTLAQHGWDEARVAVHRWTPIPGYPLEHPCNQTLRLHAAACHGTEVDLCFQAWPLDTRTVDTPIAQILVLINTTWTKAWRKRLRLRAKRNLLAGILQRYAAIADLSTSELGAALRSKITANWISRDQLSNQLQETTSTPQPGKRKKLAWVTPMPPAKTGIAAYADALVSPLEAFYDVTVVSDQHQRGSQRKSINWLLKHGGSFDRIVYHIGNSPFHRTIAECAQQWPGINVMHELFIGDLQNNRGRGHLYQELYTQHGYRPIQQASSSAAGLIQTLERFPASERMIDHSLGNIVHSSDAQQQLNNLATHPVCETVPMVCRKRNLPSKTEARASLGIPEDTLLICSFGMLGEGKGSIDILTSWSRLEPNLRRRTKLVFVGRNSEGTYGDQMIEAIKALPCQQQISITGWTDDATYEAFLASCDLAIQLRRINRGETSAAVTDVVCSGVPIVVNRKGSFQEIKGDGIFGLPSNYNTEELTQRIEEVLQHQGEQGQVADQRRDQRQRQHDPRAVASKYHNAIESIYSQAKGMERLAIQQIARLSNRKGNDDTKICSSILATFPAQTATVNSQPRLFVDVTQIARNDLKTGIQRVVRAIVLEWIQMDLQHRIEPVYLSTKTGEWHYRYARDWTFRLITDTAIQQEDDPVSMRAGDQLVLLDLNGADLVESSKSGLYERLREQNIRITGIVYDILPILRPDCFPEQADLGHQRWLDVLVRNTDQMVCISKAVANETQNHLNRTQPALSPPPIGWFHLGADLNQSGASQGWHDNHAKLENALKSNLSFLMVGTIEPRKGHLQAIQAVEQLIDQGEKVNLIIVGKEGWMVKPTIKAMETSPYGNQNIFWLNNASDEYLNHLYENCDCLIAASEAEGFGLPLIEAAMKDMPVVARDIPVFREVAQQGAFFFNGADTDSMARDLRAWIQLFRDQAHPKPDQMNWLSWKQSAEQLLNQILHPEQP